MRSSKQYRNLFRIIFLLASILVVAIIALFVMGNLSTGVFITSLSSNVITALVALLVLNKVE